MKTLGKITLLVVVSLMQPIISSAGNNLSYEEKIQTINSLRIYESQLTVSADPKETKVNSQASGAVATAASPATPNSQSTATTMAEAFSCDKDSQHNCELQQFMHKMENGPTVKKALKSDGKYRITVSFDNDGNFPTKYVEKESFEKVPNSSFDETKNKIFEHYLGSEYSSYAPELVNSYQSVVSIAVHVESSDELSVFLDDTRVQGIHHIGNQETDLEEGYH